MKIYIIGNPLVQDDSVPMTMLLELQKCFPNLSFEETDPNENFIPEEGSVIVDTVLGISTVTMFTSLEQFIQSPRVSAHDYDLGLHLALLWKMGKVGKITILGIPNGQDPARILQDVIRELAKHSKNQGKD